MLIHKGGAVYSSFITGRPLEIMYNAKGISSWFWVSPLLHYDLSCRYHFKELIPSLFGYNICHAGSLLENKCFSFLDHYLLYP